MKQFNQVITVEVSVDTIAEKLLSVMDPNFVHAEMLAECIIATSLDKGTIGYIYNNLNGFTNDVNFQVGDDVTCTDSMYSYLQGEDGSFVEKRSEIGVCRVIEIDIYRSDKLKIAFDGYDSKGNDKVYEKWVNHKYCKYWAV